LISQAPATSGFRRPDAVRRDCGVKLFYFPEYRPEGWRLPDRFVTLGDDDRLKLRRWLGRADGGRR
jgi:hypothetical protein